MYRSKLETKSNMGQTDRREWKVAWRRMEYGVNQRMKRLREKILQKSEGMGTVEIILIIVCLVGLVIIFKSQITDLVESIFSKITSQTNRI